MKETLDTEGVSEFTKNVLQDMVGSTILGMFTFTCLEPTLGAKLVSIYGTLLTITAMMVGLYGFQFIVDQWLTLIVTYVTSILVGFFMIFIC